MVRATVVVAILAVALGCATSRQVIVNPSAQGRSFRSAHLVIHGEPSDDVDASIQRELLLRGLAVTAGSEEDQPADADLLVRYVDDWKWDLVMYLKRLDLQIYDGQAGNTLLASATWKNSALHGYHGLDKVVAKLVDETFTKIGDSR
jgi:hypothetical protein